MEAGSPSTGTTVNSGNNVCGKIPFTNDVDSRRMGQTSQAENKWVYIPIRVVSKRSNHMEGYKAYSLYKPSSKWANQSELGWNYEFTKPGCQKGFEGCKRTQDVVGKIRIVSWGLNYDGYAEEFVIVDNRFGISNGHGFLPIKKPNGSSPSDFIVAAFDSCGRVCRPYLNKKEYASTNTNFGGGFRISTEHPKQYSDSYEEAMLSIWDLHSPSYSPTEVHDGIPITFFCEYTDVWIWESYPVTSKQSTYSVASKQSVMASMQSTYPSWLHAERSDSLNNYADVPQPDGIYGKETQNNRKYIL